MWYECFNYLLHVGFLKIKVDFNVYIKHFTSTMFVILGLYVDDSILFLNNIPLLNTTKMELSQAFDMGNLTIV
jgi:hypothetical protein